MPGETNQILGLGAWSSSVAVMVGLAWRFEKKYVDKLEISIEKSEARIKQLEDILRKKDTYQNQLRIMLLHQGVMPPEEEQ